MLGGRGGLHAPFAQGAPYARHDGGKYHYKEGVEGLNPGGGHFPPQDDAVGLLGGDSKRSIGIIESGNRSKRGEIQKRRFA